MNVGFAVIGRPFNPNTEADGYVRNEPAILLNTLAARNPDTWWEVIGQRQRYVPWDMGRNVQMHISAKLDHIVIWLAGGFAAMRQDTPRRDGEAQEYRRTLAVYVEPITDILRAHTGDVTWIINDPRSYFRARDVAKPREILCQHNFFKEGVLYRNAGTDMAAVPYFQYPEKPPWRRGEIDVVASVSGKHGRAEAIERWGVHNWYPLKQAAYTRWLQLHHETLLFPPSSRSRWITAKFWECAATGVIPWLAEGYDSQNISGIDELNLGWLRVSSPVILAERRRWLWSSESKVQGARLMLRRLFEHRYQQHQLESEIEARLGL